MVFFSEFIEKVKVGYPTTIIIDGNPRTYTKVPAISIESIETKTKARTNKTASIVTHTVGVEIVRPYRDKKSSEVSDDLLTLASDFVNKYGIANEFVYRDTLAGSVKCRSCSFLLEIK